MNETKQEWPIRRVIRRRDTREYFRDDGWTLNPDEARNFSDSLEAAQTCVHHGLVDVELALLVSGQNQDVFCTAIR